MRKDNLCIKHLQPRLQHLHNQHSKKAHQQYPHLQPRFQHLHNQHSKQAPRQQHLLHSSLRLKHNLLHQYILFTPQYKLVP
jgi:hypothetical protein